MLQSSVNDGDGVVVVIIVAVDVLLLTKCLSALYPRRLQYSTFLICFSIGYSPRDTYPELLLLLLLLLWCLKKAVRLLMY